MPQTLKQKQITASFSRGFRAGTLASREALKNLEQQVEGISDERESLYKELTEVKASLSLATESLRLNENNQKELKEIAYNLKDAHKAHEEMKFKYMRMLEVFRDYVLKTEGI